MPSRFFGSLYCARQEGLTCGVIQSFKSICSAFSEDLKGSVHTLYAFLPPIQHVVSAHIFISHMVFWSPAYSSQFNTCSSGCPYLYSKCNVNANYSNLWKTCFNLASPMWPSCISLIWQCFSILSLITFILDWANRRFLIAIFSFAAQTRVICLHLSTRRDRAWPSNAATSMWEDDRRRKDNHVI